MASSVTVSFEKGKTLDMGSESEVYSILPGFEVPVSDALDQLSAMWNAPASEEGKAPSEFRASRMNLLLHLGFDCTPEEAKELFYNVLEFSRRYPCRVIVLCAHPESWNSESGVMCKIFSECYIGESLHDMSCCEALVLGYSLGSRQFVENQVSIFLESDLPTYYWPYRFDSTEMLSDYQFFFKEANRIIFDTSKENFLVDQIDIPQMEKVHDLAYSRLLSIRQSIGQFLSSYQIDVILEGLEEVVFNVPKSFKAEGRAFLSWVGSVLEDCGAHGPGEKDPVTIIQNNLDTDDSTPRLVFVYRNNNGLECTLDLEKGEAHIDATFGSEKNTMTAAIKLLEPNDALAESMFFS